MNPEEETERALKLLPRQHVKFACGYGSRILERSATSQMDLLLAVDSNQLQRWHEINLSENPEHYAPKFRRDGYAAIKKIAYDYGPPIMYNVSVPLGDEKLPTGEPLLFKYGVIGSDQLINDLTNWSHIYVAGRLHKPVYEARLVKGLEATDDPVTARLKEAQHKNLTSAVLTSLLLLPEKFTDSEMFKTIAGLSYMGDIRMMFGENPDKVSNILTRPGNLEKFQAMYSRVLVDMEKEGLLQRHGQTENFSQNTAKHVILTETRLPRNLEAHFLEISKKWPNAPMQRRVQQSLFSIIGTSSRQQSLKGTMTAGLQKSVAYALKKVAKNLLGRFGRMLK